MEWSEPKLLYTGYAQESEWIGKWIGSGRNKPFYARRTFEATKSIKQAFFLISGLGHFKLFMNGNKVGLNEMDPGWTNYDRSVQYVCFDVTNQITEGENVIGISVGNGFYSGDSGGRHFYTMDKGYIPYGDELLAIGELHIEFEDGSSITICTKADEWKIRDSATTLANVYGSENYDARLYPKGWNEIGFIDADWESAKGLVPPKGKLVSQSQPPVVVRTIYDTIQIEEVKESTFVFDLGQNMSGMFEIFASGPAGSKVTIKPGELRNVDGTVATPWDIVTYSEYTLAGTGAIESWKPDFSCYGARWVQIEGCTRDGSDANKPVIHDVKGHFVTSASLDTGELATNDSRITRLENIIVKAIESNLQSVHSDCPTIEKLGWLETANLMGPSIMYVKHVEELWLKITRDMIEAQTDEGLIPDIAPEYSKFEDGFRDSIAWGSSIVLVPELLWRIYGNRQGIEEAYPAMKSYMSYLKTKEVAGGLIGHGLGDWGIHPQTGGDYIENVETAFYYRDYLALSNFADMLGFKQDAVHYAEEAERVRRMYNELLLKPIAAEIQATHAYSKLGGEYDPDNQVIQAVPLYFGLVPKELKQDIECALLRAVKGRQLRSGEIGLRFLFGALSNMERNDIVFDMMMQPEHPSYIRFVEKGETALPEFWTDDARSRNHDMMGHILEWMYAHLLGISSVEEAYKIIRIAPLYSDRVNSIRGKHLTARGLVEVDFYHDDDEIRLKASLPPNTIAKARIPLFSGEDQLHENGIPIGYELVWEQEQPYAIVEVVSGSYDFLVRVFKCKGV